MGGSKKRSLAQIEKQQQHQDVKKTDAKTGKAKTKSSGISLQEVTKENLKELASIKALTLFAVATKCNVRLSVAKDILETLEKSKTIQQVASGTGLKIYKFT